MKRKELRGKGSPGRQRSDLKRPAREDQRAIYGELRFQSVGWYAGDMLFVVWTPGKNDCPHIISARKAEKHERAAWAKFVRK